MLTRSRKHIAHIKQSFAIQRHVSNLTSPQIIFSGIQPTGIPHLGNYLGALRSWVHLQNTCAPTSTLIFCVVDLHALTTQQDASRLRVWKRETFATLLAIGLDPARSVLFHQSAVSAHAELHWLLSCNASMGYLSRMTQWKTKAGIGDSSSTSPSASTSPSVLDTLAARQNRNLKLGLFSYPVLQAADILVHGATHVPVGEDQVQHIEFARECAGAFNAVYGAAAGREILVRPVPVVGAARRVMSLTEPAKKMSKSAVDERSRILLTDEREIIERKVRLALTDSMGGVSYDPDARPGVSNLVDILVYLTEGRREDVVGELEGATLKALKERVADEIDANLKEIRERIKMLLAQEGVIERAAEEGAEKARQSAQKTLASVREAVGLD